MKKITTFATTTRIHAMLCCSAAVLLTACGGGVSDPAGSQADTRRQQHQQQAGTAYHAQASEHRVGRPHPLGWTRFKRAAQSKNCGEDIGR